MWNTVDNPFPIYFRSHSIIQQHQSLHQFCIYSFLTPTKSPSLAHCQKPSLNPQSTFTASSFSSFFLFPSFLPETKRHIVLHCISFTSATSRNLLSNTRSTVFIPCLSLTVKFLSSSIFIIHKNKTKKPTIPVDIDCYLNTTYNKIWIQKEPPPLYITNLKCCQYAVPTVQRCLKKQAALKPISSFCYCLLCWISRQMLHLFSVSNNKRCYYGDNCIKHCL